MDEGSGQDEGQLEKILHDLQGISVFGSKSHIKGTYRYPDGGIWDERYSNVVLQEWSSDDYSPGGGAGDWYECETLTKEYLFIENFHGSIFQASLGPEIERTTKVHEAKRILEDSRHNIQYIIRREETSGPNWGWFHDYVYVVKEAGK